MPTLPSESKLDLGCYNVGNDARLPRPANSSDTVTASAEDCVAIQGAEMNRLHAWMGGKLRIDGDMTVLLQQGGVL